MEQGQVLPTVNHSNSPPLKQPPKCPNTYSGVPQLLRACWNGTNVDYVGARGLDQARRV